MFPGRASMLDSGHVTELEPYGGNMSKPYPANVLIKLREAVATWNTIDPRLKIGPLMVTELDNTLKRGEALKQEILSLEARLTDLRNQRDDVYRQSWNYIVRMRAGIKGIYGDDASEYEMAGGTRRSERKPRSRRVKTESA